MDLIFKSITLRNFLSFGNNEQTIELNKKPYQVIVGYNKDKSDSASDRNGVGKSTMFEAIHYALFGKSIGNKVTLGNLNNNINKKNMVVTLSFTKDGVDYVIERGRTPNFLKFTRNGESVVDETQGDSRETQSEIEKILGMNEDVYNQIVCLSCKVPVFLEQTTANQKQILEKILGVDVIGEKIDSLKSLIKETKNDLNNETFKYNTIKTQNDALKASIDKQINDMNVAKEKWLQNINYGIEVTKNGINYLEQIDIDKEMENFKLLENYLTQEGVNQQNQQLKNSLEHKIKESDIVIRNHQARINILSSYDYESEKANFAYNESLQPEMIKYWQEENRIKELKTFKEQNLEYNFKRLSDEIKRKQEELANIKEDVCPTCGQPMGVEEVAKIKNEKMNEIKKLQEEVHQIDLKIIDYNHEIQSFVPKTFEQKPTQHTSMYELLRDESELSMLKEKLEFEKTNKETNEKALNDIVIVDLGEKPQTHYSSMNEIMNHKGMLQSHYTTLKSYEDQLKTNPFEQQEKSIEEMKTMIVDLDDSAMRNIADDLAHQETLLKLLNSPSSFIRKTILDKSLEFLNSKIMQYLAHLGSLHTVTFNNDMSISISYMGVEYGYVSSGEMGRISTALTLAFRDVWETLNNCSVNLLAMDEVIDRIGLDTSGVEMMVNNLKSKQDKNVMLVTHNEVLINQAPELLTLIKEDGFTEVVRAK